MCVRPARERCTFRSVQCACDIRALAGPVVAKQGIQRDDTLTHARGYVCMGTVAH